MGGTIPEHSNGPFIFLQQSTFLPLVSSKSLLPLLTLLPSLEHHTSHVADRDPYLIRKSGLANQKYFVNFTSINNMIFLNFDILMAVIVKISVF
jgi:hypothetical protein